MPKVLFVEDDPFIAEIYKKKFESSGFDVLNVTNGKAVFKEAKENKYDLVLLDLVIPEMSGTEVLRELRHNPEYPKDLKVIIFSNLSSQEDREQCLKLGANGFISKTEFSPSGVVDEVNRFLRQFNEQEKNFSRQEHKGDMSQNEKKQGKRVLFIEDEAVFVEMFGKRLSDEGYDVVIERDGRMGLERATNEQFDMIVSDVRMPGMTGHEMALRLRDTEKNKNTPMVLLSASMEEEYMKELSEAGIVNKVYMKTQITPSELTYAVNDFFRDKDK
ncbi:MAG: response regulator [Candidatus Moranbacteria bacterium]|nr:response regulator [Candidatus Moranbacteria bacterium]